MSTHIAGRNIFAAGVGMALIALLTGPVQAGPEEEAIENKLQQYEARFNAGDAEAVAKLFAEDAVYYGPLGNVFEGRDAVEERYRRSLEAGFSDMSVEALEIRILEDTAYDVARYTIMSPAGEPLTGYHLAILENEGGEWIVKRTLVNAKMPEPSAE